jgi:hypothetical protein
MPTATPTPCVTVKSINSRFNNTSISAGRRIWFNSHVDVSGTIAEPVTVYVTNQTVVFSANGNNYSLDVPDAVITLDPAATEATTTFDSGSGRWMTTIPAGLSGSIFLSGLSYTVASGGLPRNINPVSWSATFTASAPGISLDWAWAAAVYTSFSADYNALGVKPVDSQTASSYNNTHKAGTPENYTSSVRSGATGGGGSNYTGSDSNTASISFCG